MTATPHPSDTTNEAGRLDPSVLREMLYHGHRAVVLEAELAKLATDGAVTVPQGSFAIDPASVAIALAFDRQLDASGDVCAAAPGSVGAILAFGGTALEYLRQCGGRGTAPSDGRTTGAGWTDLRRGLLGPVGMPGTMTQVLSGVALAFQHREESRVALAFEPAGATDTGGWHEGINLAAARRLPLIVVAERGDPSCGSRPAVGASGAAYGLEAAVVPGGDLPGIYAVAAEARRRALAGFGPTVLWVEPSPTHQSRLDAVTALGAWCTDEGHVSRDDVDLMAAQAREEVENAVGRLAKEPEPTEQVALAPTLHEVSPQIPWTRTEVPDPREPAFADPFGGGLDG